MSSLSLALALDRKGEGGKMEGDVEGSNTSRPRREDNPSSKDDPQFSDWQILAGPEEWKNHSSGKEGAERYRHANLPVDGSKPGFYELGIAAFPTDDGRVIRKLGEGCVIPVYGGASENVRARLQGYGRDGAHLENGKSPGLFTEIFKKGYSILFRWLPMESKDAAVNKEAEMLDMYDYAWNSRLNGASRRDDVPKKLTKMDFCRAKAGKGKQQASEKKQLTGSGSSRASAPTKAEHPDDLVIHPSAQSRSIVPYRPRLVQEPKVPYLDTGAADEEGCTGRNSAVHNGTGLRPEHKVEWGQLLTKCPGRRVIKETSGVIMEYGTPCGGLPVAHKRCDSNGDEGTIRRTLLSSPEAEDNKESHRCLVPVPMITHADDDNICGVVRVDGSLCRNRPDRGRKRCDEHKGWRVNVSGPEEIRAPGRAGGQSSVCGVPMAGGSICMQRPDCGRKRCEDHKGRRITGTSSMGHSHEWASVSFEDSFCCGATMGNGAPCTAPPLPGRQRCGRHKGKRI